MPSTTEHFVYKTNEGNVGFTVTATASRQSAYSQEVNHTVTIKLDACENFPYSISASINATGDFVIKNTSPSSWGENEISITRSFSQNITSNYTGLLISIYSSNHTASEWFFVFVGGFSYFIHTQPLNIISATLSSYIAYLGGDYVTLIFNNTNGMFIRRIILYLAGKQTIVMVNPIYSNNATWMYQFRISDYIDDFTEVSRIATFVFLFDKQGQEYSSYAGENYVQVNVRLPADAAPTVASGWYTLSRENVSAAQSITEWIKGYSKAVFTFDPSKVTCKYGATLKKFSIQYNGVSTDAVNNIAKTADISTTNASIICSVMDSRGLKTNVTVTVQLLDYSPPTATGIEIYRSDSQKAPHASGRYITAKTTAGITSLNNKNQAIINAAYKLNNGSSEYGNGVTIPDSTHTVINSTEILTTSSYKVRITVTDSLGNSAIYEQIIETEEVTFNLRNGGLGAAFGKVCTENYKLQLPGSWSLQIGETTLSESQLIELLNLL